MNDQIKRSHAAAAVGQALDNAFFSACCDPVRTAIVRHLVEVGEADISAIAKDFEQDRSVISRHLSILERASVTRAEKRGRHVFYALDGPAIIAKLDLLLAAIKALSEICCPAEDADEDRR